MNYGDFKDLNRRTTPDKALRDKGFDIGKHSENNAYQHGIALLVYKFFDKTTSGVTIKKEIMQNQQLVEELHKPIIGAFEKRKAHSSFINNIWSANRADMQLKSNFNKGFLLCVIDIYSKYASVVHLKYIKVLQLLMLYTKF